jgi:hypothetical protein
MLRLRPLARQLRTVSCAPNSARWARLASTAAKLSYLRSVSEEDVAHFSTLLPQSAVLSTFGPSSVDAAELDAYNKDWMDKYRGQSRVVLRPKTVEQVSEIMKYCNERGIGVVPQGGNTGLVGGSVPINDEVVINLGGMSKIRSFDSVTGAHLPVCFVSPAPDAVRGGVLVADAGCVLETLIEHIGKEDHIMPLDLGAKGRSVVLIWSPTHKLKWIVTAARLEATSLPTQAVYDCCDTARCTVRSLVSKSYFLTAPYLTSCPHCARTIPVSELRLRLALWSYRLSGYDLKQLFIGAEGTLGIVTGVSILTQAAPQSTNNVVLALPSFDNVLPLFKTVKRELSEILSAFEFFDRQAYEIVTKHNQGRALDADEIGDAQCFVLVETSGGKREHDEEVQSLHMSCMKYAYPCT